MKEFFYLDESPIYKERYILRMNHDLFKFEGRTRGSYAVFPARVLDLSYAEYLRYCRDRLGADLIGKKAKYVTAYFMKNKETQEFVKLLNRRMEYIMNVVENPYVYEKQEDGTVVQVPIKE